MSFQTEHQKEKCSFHFRKNPLPQKYENKDTKKQEIFFFLVLPSKARWWRDGGEMIIGAYDLILLHHALRAYETLPIVLNHLKSDRKSISSVN